MTNLYPDFRAAVLANRAAGALLAELQFRNGYLWLWTGRGQLRWRGHEFSGAGELVGIAGIETNNQVQAQGLTFTLSGVPLTGETRTVLANATTQVRQGLPARLWLALFNPSTLALIAEPNLEFNGLMDVSVVRLSGDSFDVSISAESRLARLQTAPGLRWDNETQRKLFPMDRGFEDVPETQNKVA